MLDSHGIIRIRYMKTITFRSLQRKTVKELEELAPVEITVDGLATFRLLGTQSDVIPGGLKFHEEVGIYGDIVRGQIGEKDAIQIE